MSSAEQERRQRKGRDAPASIVYGVKEYNLSTLTTDAPGELVRLPEANFFTVVDVPSECYVRVGNEDNPELDLRDVENWAQREPIRAMWLRSTAGATGTLKILFGKGGNVTVSPVLTIDEIENITGTVTVDETDDYTREKGKIKLVDNGGTLIAESNPLPVQDPNQSGLAHGQQSVGVAGTAEALNGGASQAVPGGGIVKVRGFTAASSDQVYVGGSGVDATNGYILNDGEEVELHVDDVSAIYVDADTAGDGVSWVVEV